MILWNPPHEIAFKRLCNGCMKSNLLYSRKDVMLLAEKNNLLCNNCKHDPKKWKSKSYELKCSCCSEILIFRLKKSYERAIKEQRKCRKCINEKVNKENTGRRMLDVFNKKYGEEKGEKLYKEFEQNKKKGLRKFHNDPIKKEKSIKKRVETKKLNKLKKCKKEIESRSKQINISLLSTFYNYDGIPKKTTGIYLILSPSNRAYIGQTSDIQNRWNNYRNPCKRQRIISNSIKKYGYENHLFIILHELPFDVDQDVINIYETFYWQQFKDCGIKVMNIKEPGSNGSHSEETKRKIGNATRGRKFSEERRKKMSEIRLGKPLNPHHAAAVKKTKGKPVLQFTLSGEFIKEFETVTDAIQETRCSQIAACCRGEQKRAGQFVWKFKND